MFPEAEPWAAINWGHTGSLGLWDDEAPIDRTCWRNMSQSFPIFRILIMPDHAPKERMCYRMCHYPKNITVTLQALPMRWKWRALLEAHACAGMHHKITSCKSQFSQELVGFVGFQWEKKWKTLKIWGFPWIGVPQNGWFIRENPIEMDDLGVPPF